MISRGSSRELFHLAFDVAQALGRRPFRRPGLLQLRRHLTCSSQGRHEAAAIFTALKKMAIHGRRSQQRLKRFRSQGQLLPTPALEGVDNTRTNVLACVTCRSRDSSETHPARTARRPRELQGFPHVEQRCERTVSRFQAEEPNQSDVLRCVEPRAAGGSDTGSALTLLDHPRLPESWPAARDSRCSFRRASRYTTAGYDL